MVCQCYDWTDTRYPFIYGTSRYNWPPRLLEFRNQECRSRSHFEFRKKRIPPTLCLFLFIPLHRSIMDTAAHDEGTISVFRFFFPGVVKEVGWPPWS